MTPPQNPSSDFYSLASPKAVTVFNVSDSLDVAAACKCLNDRGFCILRGLFSNTDIEKVNSQVEQSAPAITGAPGYVKVDHAKNFQSIYAWQTCYQSIIRQTSW